MRKQSTWQHPGPAPRRGAGRRPPWLAAIAAVAALATLGAQTPEEFELRSGQRIPVASAKPTKTGFTAQVAIGATTRTVNFTARDIVHATLRQPPQLAEARTLTAAGRPEAAVILMENLLPELEPLQAVPGNWWHLAAILQMDALATRGKLVEAGLVATKDTLARLPEDAAAMVADFQRIIAKPTTSPELKAGGLEALAKRSTDPWLAARARLESGNLLAAQGRIEQAVKAWLRVPVFHAAETDLAVRGLAAAARGLQQIERTADGVKLLTDFLADHPDSPYGEPLRADILKLDPTLKDKLTQPGP